MKPVVRSLILKRFRSIPAERVDFENPTFLVGWNGSGKSNLIDALAFLADAMVSPLRAVIDRRGGIASVRNRTPGRSQPPDLSLGVVLGELGGSVESGRYALELRAMPDYGFVVVREQCVAAAEDGHRQWFDRTETGFSSNLDGFRPALDPASLCLPVIAGDARLEPVWRVLAGIRTYAILPDRLIDSKDHNGGQSLLPDGRNTANVLKTIAQRSPNDFRRICEIMGAFVPNIASVRTVEHGESLSLLFAQEWGAGERLTFDARAASEGTLRMLSLLAAIYQQPAPCVLAFEEPEATIHPGALGVVLDVLHEASRKMQVVVSTHSPEVLDAKWIEDRYLRIVEWREGATRVGSVSDASRQALQEHLMGAGELLRSNALDPAPLVQGEPGLGDVSLFEELA